MSADAALFRINQRQDRPPGESVGEFLHAFPALLALSRLPVPILAVDDGGAIEFVNEAFSAMVGRSRDDLLLTKVWSLVDCFSPENRGAVAVLREHANSVIRLRHANGWTMPVLLSDSVLIRDDDKLAVVVATDLTEIAWLTSPHDVLLPG